MSDHKFKPESLMMSYGYKPELSEGAIKCPVFQTSTFAFKNAEEGKAFFEIAYGLREKETTEELGLIYSRLNNPDMEILENRLTLWDQAEDAAVFESGLAAITTVMLEFLSPGDLMLYSRPLYGGTDHFIQHFLKKMKVTTIDFDANTSEAELKQKIENSGMADRLKMVYVETPANPTNALIDIEMCSRVAQRFTTSEEPEDKVILAVDNTYLGPIWQHPLKHGADLVLYSATKYIGGHSDLIAGACLGNGLPIKRVKTLRTFLGNMTSPWVGWLLMRSLETLKVRMEKQAQNARKVADFLVEHPKVEKVYYLGHIKAGTEEKAIYDRQCKGAGAMLSFDIKGGEKEAFRFLNHLKLFKLAVSLGSTESLAEHPASMTHADVAPEVRKAIHIGPNMVRLSIGVEDADDLIVDLKQAFNA